MPTVLFVFSRDAKLGLYEKKVAALEQELEGCKKREGEEHQVTETLRNELLEREKAMKQTHSEEVAQWCEKVTTITQER